MNYYNYPNNAFSPPGVSNLPYTPQMGGAIQQPSYSPVQNQNNNGLIWVQGEAGAKAYLIVPGSTVMLMDSEAMRFYLKSADASGVPSLRIFEYNEVSHGAPSAPNTPPATQTDQFITRAEHDKLLARYDKLVAQYDELSARIEQMSAPEPVKRTSKKAAGGADDE